MIGIFVFGLVVVGRGQSGYAGAFALAIIMLPLVARATLEVLALVPRVAARGEPRARGAALADDAELVLPQTLGGIVTGTMLAVARVAGETAPLLFTSSIAGTRSTLTRTALASMPVTIFGYSSRRTRKTTPRRGRRRSSSSSSCSART